MSNWKKCRLGDVCYFGKDRIDIANLNLSNYISTENMLPERGGITEVANLPSVEQTPCFFADDILVSNIRPYFKKIWRATFSGGCSPDVLVFKAKENISKRYLYYILSADIFFNYCTTTSKGTKMPRGDKVAIMNYSILLPPLSVQRRITAILSALDDKIELNARMNANLEQQAQAIFKNLIADIQEDVPFTSLIQVLGGGTPKTGKKEYWNGEIPFFTPKDADSPYVLTTEKNITSLGLDNCNSRLYPVNTVFLTARGTVGKISLAGVPMSMNQSCYALIGKNELHQIVVYQYTLETIKNLKHKATGAVFDAIITRDFDTESVPALSSKQLDYYVSVAEPMYKEILNRTFENRNLAALRDALLPKLMSGEIDVSAVKI